MELVDEVQKSYLSVSPPDEQLTPVLLRYIPYSLNVNCSFHLALSHKTCPGT